MKKGSIGDPNIYLGAKLCKTRLPNGVEAWALSPGSYASDAVKNVEMNLIKEYGSIKLDKQASSTSPVVIRLN